MTQIWHFSLVMFDISAFTWDCSDVMIDICSFVISYICIHTVAMVFNSTKNISDLWSWAYRRALLDIWRIKTADIVCVTFDALNVLKRVVKLTYLYHLCYTVYKILTIRMIGRQIVSLLALLLKVHEWSP